MQQKRIRELFKRYQLWIWGSLFAIFAYYASFKSHIITAIPATYWMQIYSFKDYSSWEAFKDYLIHLRTGIPPALSCLEILSYNLLGGSEWIFKGLYRKAIIAVLILPVFFSKKKWGEMLWCLGMAYVCFESIILIHKGNPQYYDILLPLFILVYFLCSRFTFQPTQSKRLKLLSVMLAGFCLTMAELARPFMIAIVPFLVALNLYHYIRERYWAGVVVFMLPILLFSISWHVKLWHYNEHQVIWSNSSGTNLFRAWSGFVDQEAMNQELMEEAPPVLPGRWENLNTQIHYENSQIRKQYVIQGIKQQPKAALQHLWNKTLLFTRPRTDMYANDPQTPVLSVYRVVVKGLFILLPLLLVYTLVRTLRNPRMLAEVEIWLILTTAFISVMPVIGELGEEARFVISVIPLLIVCGMLGMRELKGWINLENIQSWLLPLKKNR
ncbi:MAG: hypothetical protein AAGA10_03665 [Bacteroidota bacterium]